MNIFVSKRNWATSREIAKANGINERLLKVKLTSGVEFGLYECGRRDGFGTVVYRAVSVQPVTDRIALAHRWGEAVLRHLGRAI